MSATYFNKHNNNTLNAEDVSAGQRIRRLLARIWYGPLNVSPQLRMEQRFIVLRYLGILFLAPALPLLHFSSQRLVAAYTLLMVYAGFNVCVQMLLMRRSRFLNHGYVTSLGDGLITMAMVLIGGGFESSFYLILYPTTVAAAMRYGYGPSILLVSFYVFLDAVLHVTGFSSQHLLDGNFLVRSGYLTLTALVSSYLWEQALTAEAALARQLAGASGLNESTRALSAASLQLDTIIRTVAVEARRLVGGQDVVVRLAPELGNLIAYDVADAANLDALALQRRHNMLEDVVKSGVPNDQQATLTQGTTRDGRAYVCVPLHARSGLQGHLAVVQSAQADSSVVMSHELLVSFIERATLALENASLYKTIGDRSVDLQRAYTDLASAHQELLGVDEMKTSFIANVSHELRTPLTSIRSFSELLLSYTVDIPTQQEFLGIINTESERLTRLINDVLDITKIEAGHMEWHMERLDLAELLRTSARNFNSLIEDKGLQFQLQLPESETAVWADRDRILQVLANLLGNALKFTPQGQVVLSAQVEDQEVHIGIRDTGIGIDVADHEVIFEKFHQVGDTLTEKPTGTGLGLSICRDIITHHGGRIWVESSLNNGSVFRFILPLALEVTTTTDCAAPLQSAPTIVGPELEVA
ncbi:MAG: hypothetical protein NVS2B7_18670 [Herpetosiphon sp.]